MRSRKRARSSAEPKCITAARRPAMLNPFVAEVIVTVRAAISGESVAIGICVAAWIDEVGVDLVAEDDEVALDGQVAERHQLLAGEDAAGRIVRVADHQDARRVIRHLTEILDIEHIARAVVPQPVLDQPPVRVIDRRGKGG